MRWIWSGFLVMGMLLVLWGVFEAPQDMTADPTTRYYGEDGTPVPPPPPQGSPRSSRPALSSEVGHVRAVQADVYGPAPPKGAMPTILVTGVVPRLDRLRQLGRVKRAEWGAVVRESAGPGVALAILGSAPAHVDTRAVMAELRREAATAAVPLLHLAGHDSACEGCRADVCLPALTRPETLLV